VKAGNDEVGEGEAVDLLRLVRRRQQLVHHLHVRHMSIPLEHRRTTRRRWWLVQRVPLRLHARLLALLLVSVLTLLFISQSSLLLFPKHMFHNVSKTFMFNVWLCFCIFYLKMLITRLGL
jgi:hypothetical protein